MTKTGIGHGWLASDTFGARTICYNAGRVARTRDAGAPWSFFSTRAAATADVVATAAAADVAAAAAAAAAAVRSRFGLMWAVDRTKLTNFWLDAIFGPHKSQHIALVLLLYVFRLCRHEIFLFHRMVKAPMITSMFTRRTYRNLGSLVPHPPF